MLVRVRNGYSLSLGNEVFSEKTVVSITPEEYKVCSHLIENITGGERDFYEKKINGGRSVKDIVIKTRVRKGYGYTDPNTDRYYDEGSVVVLTEREYSLKHWLFEPIALDESVKVSEGVEEKVVEEGIINNRAIVTPQKIKRVAK